MYLLDYIYMCRRISINDLFYIPRSERALNLLLKYTKWIRLERWVVCPFSKAVSYHQRPLCNPKYSSPKLKNSKNKEQQQRETLHVLHTIFRTIFAFWILASWTDTSYLFHGHLDKLRSKYVSLFRTIFIYLN